MRVQQFIVDKGGRGINSGEVGVGGRERELL